ncbi:metal ABC transporter ATP-binding protein [Canibacter zhuwentaonis]|uniref:metal ABC transporter ATP-binding protein n=1 Tax=Canibacter zhuwentaonis TaxID=2837491 RepID=UPI003D6EF45D
MGVSRCKRAIIAEITDAQPLIAVVDASFGYSQNPVLQEITMQLYAGESVALIGSNGSGKSTLLNAFVSLSSHLGGTLRVLGTSPDKARRKIGLLPQQDTRQKDIPLTAYQVAAMGLYPELGALRPFSQRHKQKVFAKLARVGLADQAKKPFGDLSGGQQQRVILARALVSDPELILLDEPFNGLDRSSRDTLLQILSELREQGCGIVVSTHDLEIAHAVCSHVLLLDKKQIAFGELHSTLTATNIATAFHDTTVEINGTAFTTRHETSDHSHKLA